MKNKKHRKQKLAAQSRSWIWSLILDVVSTVIGAALVKLLGLN